MSVKVSALIWKASVAPLEKLLLLRLADFADDSGGRIYPAVATVARDCGISERGAQYILKKFVDMGLLLIVGNANGGRGKARHYAIDLDRAASMAMAGPEGGGERVQRVQELCTLNGHDETPQTPQRVQTTTEKGAQALHPTHQGTVKEEESERARGLAIPSDAEFDEFYRAFPLHKARGAALRAYRAAVKKVPHATIMEGVLRYQRECEGVDGRWIKYPSTWLNGECWADEPDNRVNGGNNGQQRHPSSGRKPNGAGGGGSPAARRRGILDGLSKPGLDTCGAFAFG